MTIPKNEREIIEILDLDESSKLHPVPPDTTLHDFVFTLDGERFTSEAVGHTLRQLGDPEIKDLLQYGEKIMADNNLHGGFRESIAGQLQISTIIRMSISEETDLQIKNIVDQHVVNRWESLHKTAR